MLKLDLFQAGKGDSFMLTWNEAQTHRLLIDCGNQGTYRFFKSKVKEFGAGDVVIITHVDYDHIGGFFKWLSDKEAVLSSSVKVYMNTPQLVFWPADSGLVGIEHGVKLEQKLLDRKISSAPLFLDERNEGSITINGLSLTILSPREKVVRELLDKWTADSVYIDYQSRLKLENSKVTAEGDALIDRETILASPPLGHKWKDDLLNSSSIAFLLEYNETSLLFLGDANPDLVCEELERLGYSHYNQLEADLFKISHHGSKHNTTKELLELVKCSNYLISTDSSGPYYHPSRETLIILSTYGRPSAEIPITIFSNYPLRLQKLFTSDELKTLNINFEPVVELTFPLK